MKIEKITHFDIAVEFIKFNLAKDEYDKFEFHKLLLWGTISRIILYALACYNMIWGFKFGGVAQLLVALLCSFMNMTNFVFNIIRMKLKDNGENEEVL